MWRGIKNSISVGLFIDKISWLVIQRLAFFFNLYKALYNSLPVFTKGKQARKYIGTNRCVHIYCILLYSNKILGWQFQMGQNFLRRWKLVWSPTICHHEEICNKMGDLLCCDWCIQGEETAKTLRISYSSFSTILHNHLAVQCKNMSLGLCGQQRCMQRMIWISHVCMFKGTFLLNV